MSGISVTAAHTSHQQLNPTILSPCFSIYFWRAFSIRRALRSLKECIRSCAERAKEGADVSKHEPCRKRM